MLLHNDLDFQYIHNKVGTLPFYTNRSCKLAFKIKQVQYSMFRRTCKTFAISFT